MIYGQPGEIMIQPPLPENEEITQFRQQDPCLAIVALTEDLFTEDKQLRQTGIDAALTLPVNNDTLCDTLSFFLLPDGKNQ